MMRDSSETSFKSPKGEVKPELSQFLKKSGIGSVMKHARNESKESQKMVRQVSDPMLHKRTTMAEPELYASMDSFQRNMNNGNNTYLRSNLRFGR